MFPPHTEHRMSYTYLCVHSFLLQSDMYILHPLSSSQTPVYRLLCHLILILPSLHQNIQQPPLFHCCLSSNCLHSKLEGRVMCSHPRSTGFDRSNSCLLEVLPYPQYRSKSFSVTAKKLLLQVLYHSQALALRDSQIRSIHTHLPQSLL